VPISTHTHAGLTGALTLFWIVSPSATPSAAMVFVIGALGSAIIPGLQTRVLATASTAPTLGIALNASAFQIAAACAAWLGGRVIDSGPGLRPLYLVGAAVTLGGVTMSCYSWLRNRRVSNTRGLGALEPKTPS